MEVHTFCAQEDSENFGVFFKEFYLAYQFIIFIRNYTGLGIGLIISWL